MSVAVVRIPKMPTAMVSASILARTTVPSNRLTSDYPEEIKRNEGSPDILEQRRRLANHQKCE